MLENSISKELLARSNSALVKNKQSTPFIYTVAVHKGGTGKTTLSTALSLVLSKALPKSKIMVVDLDHSTNLTLGFKGAMKDSGIEIPANHATVFELLGGTQPLRVEPVKVSDSIYLLAGSSNSHLLDRSGISDTKLKYLLRELYKDFDFIIIDTHGDFCDRAKFGLIASDAFVTPIELSKASIYNTPSMMEAMRDIKMYSNPDLVFHGFIASRVNGVVWENGNPMPYANDQRDLFNGLLKSLDKQGDLFKTKSLPTLVATVAERKCFRGLIEKADINNFSGNEKGLSEINCFLTKFLELYTGGL